MLFAFCITYFYKPRKIGNLQNSLPDLQHAQLYHCCIMGNDLHPKTSILLKVVIQMLRLKNNNLKVDSN